MFIAITYTYDEAGHGSSVGRRTGMVDASGSTAWSYDLRGRVIGETKTIDGVAYTTAYSYDAMDRLQMLTYPDAAAEQLSHSYNPQGLLESVTGLKPYVLSSSYDEASRLTGRVSQNNAGQSWTTAYSYYAWTDPNLGRLQALTTTGTGAGGAETFQDMSYSYDAVGNVLGIVDGVAGQTQSFGYDDLQRLTSASAGGSEGAYGEAYQYYRGGSLQRKGEQGNANDGLYAYDDGEHVHAATSYRGNSYGYDANGNMTSRTVAGVNYNLAYDVENRLTAVTNTVTSAVTTFIYDGDGNRVKKDVDGVVTHYPNRYYETTPGSGSTKYFYADGQLISFERSPEYGDAYGRRYVFRDHLGSTSIIANGSGVRIWEDRYLPYGDIRYHSDTVTNTVQTRYRYTGQWLEEGLAASPENGLDRGLYFYGARWYDASLGRFVQPDTIVPEPGDPQALNRYMYASNNPVKYTDPTGHCEFDAQGNITRFDCSVAEFEGLSAEDRIKWMQTFQSVFGYGGWFNNIVDIITFFDESATLQNMEPGSWASWADAGVLEAIQNGRVLYDEGSPVSTSGGAAALWQQFFESAYVKGNRDVDTLKPLWAKAEQTGVEWGSAVADAVVGRPGSLEGQLIANFVLVSDAYRSIASTPYGGETVGGIVGSALCGAFCGWAGAQVGDWFTTPSSQLSTGRGPTYYSAKVVEALTVTFSR